MSFSVISQVFLLLLGGGPKFSLFDAIKLGVQQTNFWKMRHETAILDQQTQIQKFQLSLLFVFLFFETQQLLNPPIFIVF